MALDFTLDASVIMFFRDVVEELKTCDTNYYHSLSFKKRCERQEGRGPLYYKHKTWGYIVSGEDDFYSAFKPQVEKSQLFQNVSWFDRQYLRCGVEVLGMIPNRDGDKCHTGSHGCSKDRTVAELRQACIMNGLKATTKMTKTMLIRLLVKM